MSDVFKEALEGLDAERGREAFAGGWGMSRKEIAERLNRELEGANEDLGDAEKLKLFSPGDSRLTNEVCQAYVQKWVSLHINNARSGQGTNRLMDSLIGLDIDFLDFLELLGCWSDPAKGMKPKK